MSPFFLGDFVLNIMRIRLQNGKRKILIREGTRESLYALCGEAVLRKMEWSQEG